MAGLCAGAAFGSEESLNQKAPHCWERGRPVRPERDARTVLRDMASRKMSVLRTLCGRDVRAPSKEQPAGIMKQTTGPFFLLA